MKLSQDGKKADLITRIIEYQNGSSNNDTSVAATSDDKAAASSEGTATTAGATVEEVTAGEATATGGAVEASQTNTTQKEKDDAKQDESSSSLPLPAASSKDAEAEKRINRLKRFGNPDDIAKLERMEKFGTQADAVDEKVSFAIIHSGTCLHAKTRDSTCHAMRFPFL